MKKHPKYDEIKRELSKCVERGIPFSAVCYRCTDPKYAAEIISGLGSQLHGGRWTPKGSFPTVYLCETAEAALAEFLARGRRLKIPDHKALPMVMAGVKVKVRSLLNTTEGEVRDVIESFLATEKIHWRSIQDRREAVSQAIGRAAHEMFFRIDCRISSVAWKPQHSCFSTKAFCHRDVKRTFASAVSYEIILEIFHRQPIFSL